MDAARVVRMKNRNALYHGGARVLTCAYEYPQFFSRAYQAGLDAVNAVYRARSAEWQAQCRGELYQQAIEELRLSRENGYPFRPFDAEALFTVTYNADCAISLYTDSYVYTGGAHGNTVRTADTWDIATGEARTLADFFPAGFDYRAYILEFVAAEIERQQAAGQNIYFDDAARLAAETFDEDDFYLRNEGLSVYFQQYAIAPYASGILSFTLPYAEGGPTRPRCA
ncbi:MAG: DUF3298 and DUF4163 domain-containing protein [Clostridiales bacterium]|nr:DUF3298 and DUF4163 domain-containing protein [Clostridiales bacterium]